MTKNNKTSARVNINAGLLVLVAVAFGAITCYGVNQLQSFRKNLVGVSDAPALCYDEELYKKNDGKVIQDTYLCSTDGTAVTDQKDHTMFLYDRISLTSTVNSQQDEILLIAFGSMMTIASLVAAIVYWNHNR